MFVLRLSDMASPFLAITHFYTLSSLPMTKADDTTIDAVKDITLRDVIVHMQHMEQRLTAKIDKNSQDIQVNTQDIRANTRAIERNSLGISENTAAIQDLGLRIDALDEDLTATIKDTIKIRRHVGMVSVDEE